MNKLGIPVALAALTLAGASGAAPPDALVVDAGAWKLVERQSGPVNYYAKTTEDGVTFLRSHYVPPSKTSLMGWQAPEADRQRLKKVTWTWRALTLPNGGDECASGKGDSAAVVYLTWKRGLRYYTVKYVWSAVGVKGKVCDKKRNPFVAQDTVIVDSGAPLKQWRTVSVDLASEYRNHFEDGDAKAEVPDFMGLGVMSDGDQTQSESAADFGVFTFER
ncbi:MAG: hypothetical protein JWP97_1169 [Labilithrix sp.]|nr:hypothetical protein [Labilithrix sp.]